MPGIVISWWSRVSVMEVEGPSELDTWDRIGSARIYFLNRDSTGERIRERIALKGKGVTRGLSQGGFSATVRISPVMQRPALV